MLRRMLGLGLLAWMLMPGVAPASETSWALPRPFATGGQQPYSLTVGRFGGGAPEIAVPNYGSSSVAILRPDGHGGLAAPEVRPLSQNTLFPTYVAPVNLGSPQTALAVTLNNGNLDLQQMSFDGGFAGNDHAQPTGGGGALREMAVGQFDAKPRDDIAVAENAQAGKVYILTDSDPASPFFYKTAQTIDNLPFAEAVATGDFDQDGKADLAIGGQGQVWVYRGNGDGTFSPTGSLGATQGKVFDIALGDLNGDGDLDIAAASDQGLQIYYGGLGASFPLGSFASGALWGVAIADLDGRGPPEIVITFPSESRLYVLRRLEDGTYGPDRILDPGENAHHVVAFDVDGDGDLDLIASNFFGANGKGGTVTLLENTAQPQASASPSSLDFGAQAPGTIGPEQSITVTNTGHRRLQPGAASSDSGAFLVSHDACTGATVPVDGTCTVGVRFAPDGASAYAGTIRIPSDAPGDPVAVTLTGAGVAAAAASTSAATAPVPPAASKPLGLRLLHGASVYRRGHRVRLRFVASERALATLDVVRRGKRVARIRAVVSAGTHSLSWNAKRGRHAAAAGRYTLKLTLRTLSQTKTATRKIRLR